MKIYPEFKKIAGKNEAIRRLCKRLEDDGVLPYSEVIGNIHDNPELLEVRNEVD